MMMMMILFFKFILFIDCLILLFRVSLVLIVYDYISVFHIVLSTNLPSPIFVVRLLSDTFVNLSLAIEFFRNPFKN